MSITIQCQDLIFPEIRAVVFDKDGTLANSELFLADLGHRRIQELEQQFFGIAPLLLATYGLGDNWLRSDGLLAVGTRHDNEVATATCLAQKGEPWAIALSLVKQCFQQADQQLGRKADLTPVLGKSLELLRTFSSVGLRLGILSSDSTANVVDFVHRYEMTRYIHQSLGADQSILPKPNPEPFYQICELLEVMPHEVLMVGDSDADMLMAKRAGAAGAIGLSWGWTKPVPPKLADIVLADCAQFRLVD